MLNINSKNKNIISNLKINLKNCEKTYFFSSSFATLIVLAMLGTVDINSSAKKGKAIDMVSINNTRLSDIVENEDIQNLIKEAEELASKNSVLDNFYECDTIDKILKRQEELESLNLSDDDKIYKDCPLSAPLQRFIYEQSIINQYPADFLFTIIDVETRGKFDSTGEVSYNAPGNYDLGLTQQNTLGSLPGFKSKYNINSYDEAYELLKDNDYANVCAAFLLIEEIRKQYSNFDPYEYAGCYNGWLNWRSKSISREYVSLFQNAYEQKYTNFHDIESAPKKYVKSVNKNN